MTNPPDDLWNRANDPWNRPDDAEPADTEPTGTEPAEGVWSSGPSFTPPAQQTQPAQQTSGTPTWTQPPSAPSTSPPTSASSWTTAGPSSTTGPSTRRGHSGLSRKIIAVVAAAALVVAGVVYLTGRGSSDTLGTEWSVSRESLLPGVSGFRFSEGLDGTGATPFVVTDEVWVMQLVERYSSDEDHPADQLFGIDPDTGRTVWQIDLPGAVCADRTGRDGTLTCLSDKGNDWQRVQIDPATGTVTEPVPVDVQEPRQVHLSSAGLLVLSESDPQVFSQLSLLADDGSPTWSHDLLDLVGGEALFRESTVSGGDDELVLRRAGRWTDVGTSVLLGDESFVHIRPADDTLEVHHGSALSVVDDQFFYNSSLAGAVGYDATGEKLWFQPDVQLLRTADGSPGTSLLHVGTSDGALHTVDPATGELSPFVFDLSQIDGTPRQSGPAEDTYLTTRNHVLRLSSDRDAVRWHAKVSGMNSLSQTFTIGEVTVVDSDPIQGLVAASGEESWTAEEPYGELMVVDDRLVAHSAEDIRVLTMP